jgi:hypothetical protein
LPEALTTKRTEKIKKLFFIEMELVDGSCLVPEHYSSSNIYNGGGLLEHGKYCLTKENVCCQIYIARREEETS